MSPGVPELNDIVKCDLATSETRRRAAVQQAHVFFKAPIPKEFDLLSSKSMVEQADELVLVEIPLSVTHLSRYSLDTSWPRGLRRRWWGIEHEMDLYGTSRCYRALFRGSSKVPQLFRFCTEFHLC